ncbi:MAG: hypothetical protein ICV68_11485 [Pyrinomonadaceae bacterium]|nr:hypothetical protein [Pyrinomonadaceae bacterium]
MTYPNHIASRALSFSLAALLCFISCASLSAHAQNTQAKTPVETVREFYKALSQKRFREALMMSIYKPAIEGLSAAEIEELRPDFEKMAAGAEKVEVKGEQLSGETATVFVRMTDDAADAPPAPVPLLRVDGQWIVGEKSDYELVKQSGKDFFFKTRIDVHESEVKDMLQRIQLAQMAYSSKHNNTFADLPTLIAAGFVPKDLEGTESTGYRFTIKLDKDGKSYHVSAEPARYGRTGRLSFYMDQKGIKSADVGGKPLVVSERP